MSLVTRCTEFLRLHGVLERNGTLLVAASGGLDSTVLAVVTADIARRWSLRLVLGYVHHGLRVDADAEVEFVRALAGRLAADVAVRHVDVRSAHARQGGSLQEIARDLRYEALEEMRAEADAAAVLLAHHADDQAETVLAHFLRGSGVRGLAGMPTARGRLLRPLLGETRRELEREATARGLTWRHDASNDSDAYARNALRHNVIPAIRAHAGPAWPGTVVDTARIFRSLDAFLEIHIARLAAEVLQLRGNAAFVAVQPLKGYFEYEQFALLRLALFRLRGSAGTFDEVLSLQHLIDAATGNAAVLRDGFRAFRDRDAIVISRQQARSAPCAVTPGTELSFGTAVFSLQQVTRSDIRFHDDPSEEFIDLERTGSDLTLRAWTDDDIFEPLGSRRATSVGRFLASAGYSARARRDIPVLSGADGIVWVCGVRLDAHAALSGEGGTPARLTYTQKLQST
ncbi:MAG: tRNA lysidine(34) synthetase TilS [Bacteroidota bacterium]|nr:tRNA lysidine(34) synthetase TilS [Bacteroidota bacterium]